MIFGYRDAPRVFTKLMRVVVQFLRGLGIRMIFYLDDGCSANQSSLEAFNETLFSLHTMFQLGLEMCPRLR